MSVNASTLVADNLADAASLEGLPENVSAGHAAAGTEEHHVDPTALGMTATAWVSLAMVIVILLLLWKKVPSVIGASLDKKIASIRANLDEAAALRADAEKLKAEYEAKAKAAAKEAEEMLAHARSEAEAIVSQARVDATALIERRGKMAEDKIAAAERGAVAEVRAKAASAAAAAAGALIAERNNAKADKALIDGAIDALGNARF
ncbi:ATP synthase subunit B [Sphingomonas histidinilytica]|jgi:F-type H+-transporting ATPase subunit b|uniref:ATP synthase subunit b n=3 Tax=Rhizorhabdus TaxID=1649486 RepID=ATPF_RHIWR|nr:MULTISPECIES: ATP synthase subunit B [Rhizorhabdus]A5VEV8.1 RecName: Full=ATP synthase subunit b; AltName: Full=ATP synthase F(0) sector subunit b; AltName: Full=ATPase subunit I; AltName: Full=F-type ATPase subunit b; Short=F-ATPase subunit b [Rhizorhabdus wittichii RW1]QEH78954.1 ATP synthase subunit B [Sphingomonas sp. C8-2]ABQ70824.1 H+-transporting two-sector ATPase, B/B' subunit [Rhizorhabdus wittichii RW1]MBO9380522.1 ATP synthase subunit B [Rhizorhabdus histidinilytica]QTH23693.1 AT